MNWVIISGDHKKLLQSGLIFIHISRAREFTLLSTGLGVQCSELLVRRSLERPEGFTLGVLSPMDKNQSIPMPWGEGGKGRCQRLFFSFLIKNPL